MTAPRSIVIVTSAPDDRLSTTKLRTVVDTLAARPDVELRVWFLRDDDGAAWPGARVVDGLRTWWLNRLVGGLGLEEVAGRLRGLRLRWWFRQAAPDVVVLDDGLGARLLPSAPGHPKVVVRRNHEPAPNLGIEGAALDGAALVVSTRPRPDDLPATSAWLEQYDLLPTAAVTPLRRRAESARPRLRERFGVADGVPLVVGWGSDSWVDGSDLFVRALWYLADRHGIEAHGIWFDAEADRDHAHRLRSEAERCGLRERLHVEGSAGGDDRWGADAVFLPTRIPVDADELVAVAAAGIGVVTFTPVTAEGPAILEVPLLDLEASAAALADVLGWSDDQRLEASMAVEASRWVDGFLAALDRL